MKNETLIYSDILASIKTVESQKQLLSEIDILLDALFQTSGFEKAFESISLETAKALKENILKINLDVTKIDEVTEFLNGLKNKIKSLKTLKLYLAFSPSKDLIDKLFNWIINNLGNSIILSILEDKTILGGTIIEFNGQYLDYSLKKRLEDAFFERKNLEYERL